MAKEVSVGVKVKLQADAKEMQRIIDDLETRLSNVKTDSSLGKSLFKQLQKMKDSLGDFNLLSGQQIINSSDLTTATTLARNFYKQVGRFSEDYEKGSFSAFSFDKKQLKEFEAAQKALEDFDKSRKDSLNKKTNGEVFGKYAEEAKGIQKAFKEIKKDVNEDSSFLDTKKDIERSKKKAQEEASDTERKLVRETQLKQEADVAKQSAENNLKIKQQELAKVQKLEQSYQKRKEVADEISKKESFKDAKEFRDYFNSSVFQKGGTNFKGGGQEKANQILALMGFNPDEIPEGAKQLKEKIAKEISNASDDEVKSLADKMYGNAKDFSSKGYKDAQKKTKTASSHAQKEVDNAQKELDRASEAFEKKEGNVKELESSLSTQQLLAQQLDSLEKEIDSLWKKLNSDEEALNKEKREELKADVEEKKEKVMSTVKGYTGAVKEDASKLYQGVHSTKEEEKARQQAEQEAANFKANLQASIKHWMGAQQVITLVKQGIRQAYQDIQGLDKAMTNIAVVTDFNVSDLWGKINEYMSIAQQYGVTTQGVYEVSQLYFQQGLGEADTMAATTETLKMARIAGMDYAEAADGMTVAIRGFNMEMQDAARVTDVYSKVAAITASDTQELVTAMSKTASSAASVGSSFEDTTAMLAVMVEATRESPQNIGSAMKSIISRYGEMTKGLSADSEGEEIDYNRVDTALKSVGISLKDAQGQFRNFNEVIFELADTWDTLDSVTQRYIATIFAGNRQQSRFLALVSNADRLREVSEAAANSEDAGLLQYSKTLDSLETKLNNIKTSFQQFYMSLINGDNVKGLLDFINDLIKGLNKLSKFTSILNFGSIVIAVKTIGNLLINGFTSGMSQIQTNWRMTMQQLVEIARKGGIDSANAFNSGAQGMGKGGAGKQGGFSTGSKALLNGGLMLGGALSLYGTSLAQKNQTAGAIVSGIGNMTTYGIQGGLIGFSAGGPYGAAIGAAIGALGGLVSMISSIPTAVEKAQQKSEQAQQEAEEANVKRAEAKQRVSDLESGIDQLTDLSSKRFDSLEAEKEWLDANNAFYEKFPELAATFEDGTNAIVDLESAELLLAQARAEGAEAAREAAKKAYEQAKTDRETAETNKAAFESETVSEANVAQYVPPNIEAENLYYKISEYRKQLVKEGVYDAGLTYQSQRDPRGYNAIMFGSKAYQSLFTSGIDLTDKSMLKWLFGHEKMTEEAILQSVINNLKAGTLKFAEGVDQDTFVSRLTGKKYTTAAKLIAAENLLTQKSIYASKAEEQADLNRTSVEVSALMDENFSQADFLELENARSLIQKSIKQKHKESGKTFDEFEGQIPALVNGAVEAQQLLWESLYGTGQIDEFNSLIQSMSSGKITDQIFNDQIVQLFGQKLSDLPEELQNAINLYYNDFTDNLKTRQDAVKTSLTTNREVTWEEGKVDVLLANVAETYYDQLIDFANIIETRIGEGTLTKEVGESQINGLIDLLNQTANLPIEQIGQAQQILLESDLFTTLGQQEAIQKLQEAGIDVSKINPTVISTYAENLITQYGILQDKLISNLKSTTEALENASNGTTLEEASSIAKKVGKDVTELFDFQDGKYFAKNAETLNQIYTAYSDSQKEALNESLTHQISLLDRGPLAEKGRIEPLTDEEQSEYNQLIEQYQKSALAWANSLDPESLAAEGLSDKSTDIDKIKAYLKDYSEDISEAIDNETQWQLEQATKALAINNRTHELQGKGVGEDLRNAYSLLSSKGMTGYSAEEIAQLEQYLGVGKDGLGAIETGEGTGQYRIDLSKLKDLKPWVWNAINSIIEESVISTEENLASLGEKMGANEATISDATEAFGALQEFMGWTNEFLIQTITQSLGNREQLNDLIIKQLLADQGRYDILEAFKNTPAFLMPTLTEEQQAAFDAIKLQASEYGDGMIAAYAQSAREKLTKFYELSQDMILGDISPEELEELGDMGFDVSKFNTNLIAALMQHGQQVIDQMAQGNIDFDTGKELLEKDYENALAARAYAEEFNVPLAQVTGLNAKSLSYFSDTMETVRKSENAFDSAAAGKIASSVSTMLGIPEMAGQILSLFNWDQDEKFWSIDKDNTKRMLDAFNAGAGSEMHRWLTQATEGEQAYAHLLSNKGSQADFQQLATLANQIEDPEHRQSALTTLQAMQSFYDVVAEADLDKKIKDFDKTKAFADDLESTYQSLASGEEITAEALQEIFETLDYTPEQDVTEIVSNGADAILSSIESAIQAGAQTDADAAEIAARIGKLRAILLDSIISSISSNSSNLKSGIEGTLSASDWTAAVKKYGLSAGRATQTAKGLRLDNAAQLEYATAIYKEALDNDLAWDAVDAIYEQVAGTEGIFESYESIRAEMAGMIDDNGIVLDQYKEQYALLQSMAHSALMNPDDSRFSFMEQDSAKGMTQSFDKFVDNIDKVKNAFSSFQSDGTVGYQDFWNMMDYMNKFGADGGTNQFISKIAEAGYTYEDFINTVVAKSKEFGKVDIGTIAAEMGISVDAAMSAMSEGMTESLKEVARQQIKYLSGLEAMLEALLIFEAIGKIDFGLNMEIDINGDGDIGPGEKFAEYQELFDWYNGLPSEDQKIMLAKIKVGFENRYGKETGGDIFSAFFGDGNIDFWDEALGSILDDKTSFDKFKEAITSGSLKDVFAKASKNGNLGEGLAEYLTGSFSMEGITWENLFTYDKDGMVTGLSKAAKEKGLTLENIMNGVLDALTDTKVTDFDESYRQKITDAFGTGEGLTIDGDTFGPIQIKDITGSGFTLEGDDIDLSNEGMVAEITSMLNEKLASQGLEVESIMEVDGKIKVKVKPKFESDSDFTEGWDDSELQGILSQQFPDEINGDPITVTYNAQADLKYNITLPSDAEIEDPQKYIEKLMGVKVENLTSTGENSLDYQFNISWGTTGTDGTDLSKPFTDANQAAANLNTQIGTLSSTLSSFTGGQAFTTLATDLSSAATDATTLITQLSSTVDSSSIVTQVGSIKNEVDAAVKVAQQLSEALSMDKPLEVKFDVTESNTAVTTLLTNLGSLNTLFQPTVTVDDAEAQETIADIMLQLENVGVQNPTPQVDVIDNASATLEKIINLIASISSKTVTITTKFVTIGSPPGSTDIGGGGGEVQLYTGTINNITGTAYADGSVGSLYSGAKLANKTLVGELGPELAVYDGQYHLLGQTGAEFVELPDDALVFNHLQTAGIISGQMKNARAQAFKGRADAAIAKSMGSAMATGNVTGPALASGIAGALAAVRRAKSVWQGLLNSLSAADLMGAGGGGGGGGGDESLKAHIADLQEWYNLSRQIADIEGQINVLLAKRKNLTDGHEYLKNLRETQRLLDDQVNTQQDLLRFQELQLQRQAEHINSNKIWSQFLEVDENGLLQYKKGNETNGGKGALEVLSQMNEMSGEEQLAFVQSLGWSYTNTDGEELEDAELVAKFYEELQKQIDDYDALRDTVQETEGTLADLEEQINEIEKEIRDNEIDLSQEIYDIIVDAWKENIENLKEQNDLIKEANEAYANGIQEVIDAERQMYDQNTAISDREQLQRQLALMRRSGGSASEIADLEKQLDDMFKEEYFTNQEKQLETIQKANERQAELLDQQVKIQEDLLEYQQENGVIWNKVYEVLSGTDAEIVDFMQGNKTDFFEQSALQQEDMLTEWAKKIGIYTEERQRQNYAAEAAKTFGNVWNNETGRGLQDAYNRAGSAQQEKWKREYNDTYASKMLEGKSHEEALKFAQEEFYEHLRNWIKAEEDKKKQQQQQATTSSSGQSSEGSGTSEKNPNQRWKASGRYGNSQGDRTDVAYGRTKEEALKNLPHPRSFYNISYGAYQRYAKGGIIDFTGPAWVDGSKSKPERILSAEQNKILEEGLAMNAGRSDKLREMFSNFAENLGASVRASISNIANRTSSSAITIQPGAVQLNIEQLNDKYDVDELFNDVADRLYSIAAKASGRGVSRR